MRYVGQGHEIPVPLPARPLGADDVPQIRAAYDAEYTRFYDRPVPGSDVEIMSYAVVVATVPQDDLGTPVAGDDAVSAPDADPLADTARARHDDRRSLAMVGARPRGARTWRAHRRPGDHRRGRNLDTGQPRLERHGERPRLHRTDAGERLMAHETNALAQIHRQIMWNRLIAVVEEQAQTMIRTAFSTTVREAGDLSAGIFDLHGRMMAQAVTGTPGHVNSMAESVGHFLRKFPADTMQPTAITTSPTTPGSAPAICTT